MRLDLLLVRLRFAKTRTIARGLAISGFLRINGVRVIKPSHPVRVGDVLTIPRASGVLVATIDRLPERRGPPAEAREAYRILDPASQTAIAGPSNQHA